MHHIHYLPQSIHTPTSDTVPSLISANLILEWTCHQSTDIKKTKKREEEQSKEGARNEEDKGRRWQEVNSYIRIILVYCCGCGCLPLRPCICGWVAVNKPRKRRYLCMFQFRYLVLFCCKRRVHMCMF